MADLHENDAAHANLLSETLGIDLKKSEKVQKETAENDQNSSMPDLLSQLANSKIKRSAKKSNDKTFDVADDGPAQQRADRAAKYKNAISKDMDKWEAIARANERKTGVIFPLTSNDSKAIKKQFGKEASAKTENHSYAFKPRYDYEKELENLYNASENLIRPDSKTGLTEFAFVDNKQPAGQQTGCQRGRQADVPPSAAAPLLTISRPTPRAPPPALLQRPSASLTRAARARRS